MKIYGPYLRKDGRQHVILVDNGKKKTVSYGKYLLEQKIGRSLESHETCDHIDGDFTNNDLTNLQVLSRRDNILKYAAENPKEVVECKCKMCGKKFSREARYVRGNKKQGKSGPYCSKSCGGKVRKGRVT